MSYGILTKIDRELLQLDPNITPRRQLRHLAWSRSSLNDSRGEKERAFSFAALIFAFKRMLGDLLKGEETLSMRHFEEARPKLAAPFRSFKEGSYRPARYFSKGGMETDSKKNPAPIPYLLIETNEISAARPVPGNSLFLRSLAKGKGNLRKNSQGLFYLDIDNRFILTLIPYLKAYGLVRPPYFNLFSSPDGAHIPVIPPREAAFHYLNQIEGLDQEFSFEIDGLYSIEPTLWPQVEQVWFFKVRSPALEELRRRNFLISKPGGHSFHIAVAIKPRQTQAKQPQPLPLMRINIACLAA